jgi:hypothetical protein
MNWHQWQKSDSISCDAKVFGQVACHVCSKPLGCGSAKRTWGTFKHLKNGKRSHLGADRAVRQATQAAEETSGLVIETQWSDADIVFQMETMAGLNNAKAVIPVPVPGSAVPVPFVPAPVVDWLLVGCSVHE